MCCVCIWLACMRWLLYFCIVHFSSIFLFCHHSGFGEMFQHALGDHDYKWFWQKKFFFRVCFRGMCCRWIRFWFVHLIFFLFIHFCCLFWSTCCIFVAIRCRCFQCSMFNVPPTKHFMFLFSLLLLLLLYSFCNFLSFRISFTIR